MAGAVLIVAMGLQQLPTTQSSSSVRVGSEGTGTDGEAPPEEEAPSTSTTTAPSPTTTTTEPRRQEHLVHVGPYQLGPAIDLPPPPTASDRRPGEPVVSDPQGDAGYQSESRSCVGMCTLASNYRSQPAADLLWGDASCTARDLVLSFGLLDPDAPLDPSGSGEPPEKIVYRFTVPFDDGWKGGSIQVDVTRSVADGNLATTSTMWAQNPSSPTSWGTSPIEPVEASIKGNAIEIRIPWEASSAAMEAIHPDLKAPAPGSTFRLLGSDYVYFSGLGDTETANPDEMYANTWYRLCD